MVDQLEAALRRWERIQPTPQPVTALHGQELSDWLDHEVCRVVDGLVARPDFQLSARWPIDELVPGASSTERKLVELVDTALVEIAQHQVTYSTRASVRQALLRLGPHNEPLPDKALTGVGNEATVPHGLSLVEQIAGRPWHDLVSESDFFYPACDLNLKDREAVLGPDSQRVQIGQFMPLLNPQLRRLGDHMSRSLLIRIEYWESILQRYAVRCGAAIRMAGENAKELRANELRAWRRLRDGYDQLKDVCFGGPDAARREACIGLLQVYAAYRPRADVSWLGPISRLSVNAAVIRDAVERRADIIKPEQVAVALAEVADLYRGELDEELIIKLACQKYALVLVEGPGRWELYWQGEPVEVDWKNQNAPWALLTTLVMQGQQNCGTDVIAVKESRARTLKDARHRLKRLLPPEIDAHIKPAGTGTYRLELPVEQMTLLRVEQDDRLVPISR